MMSPPRILVAAAVLAAAGLSGWFAAGGSMPGPGVREATAVMSDEQLLALSFVDAGNATHSLAQWEGRILVVNFWATWCAPCRREIPDFAELSRGYAGRGVQFVGLGIDSAQNIARFASEHDVPYPLLVAGTGALPIMEGLGNSAQALPFTLIVDRGGRIRERKLGPMDRASLSEKLDALLEEHERS